MQALITRELELNGVQLDKYPWLSSESVTHELSMASIPEIHEGRIAPFGVIFAEDATELAGVNLLALRPEDIGFARRLANGMDCFLLYKKDIFFGLARFTVPLMTELQLVRSFPPSGGMVVQRGKSGKVKFFQGDSVILHENRVWFTKPHVKKAAWKVAQCVSGIDQAVLNRILELTFHLLSPDSRVGATLVWCLSDAAHASSAGVAEGQDLTRFDLSIMDEGHAGTICHMLSQVDGATFLSPVGKLIRTGVHLKYSAASREFIPELRGTRHTSAQRFSFDVDSALVITVSEDGPVTIFSDGASIANLHISSSYKEARILKASAPEMREDISSQSFEASCSRCGKKSMLEQVSILGQTGELQVCCPVCQAPLHSACCLSLEARPFKRQMELTI
jgi:DNA integrity scanning protein DisA with diadenylate cyclase activity